MKLGLLGHNISYSRTPAIFEAIFKESGIGGETKVFDIPPDEFDSFSSELKRQDLSGMSVTIPYKQLITTILDQIDLEASELGAVNSIHFQDGLLKGYNTDIVGFGLPLRGVFDKLADKSVCIIGAGGAAKAAVYSLHTRFGLEAFTVLGRDRQNLSRFAEEIRLLDESIQIETAELGVDFSIVNPKGVGLIVNCSPLGGPNLPDSRLNWDWSLFDSNTIYYDTNYNLDNGMIREAGGVGLATIDGSRMLVGQAIESFRIWTDHEIPFEPIHNRIFGETKR